MSARRKIYLLWRPAVAGAILMALAAVPARPAGKVYYTGSLQWALGNYFFNQTTQGLFFFNGFSISSENFTLSASVPLIYQNSPYISYSGVGLLPSGGTESAEVGRRHGKEPVVLPEVVNYKQYGIGDPLLYMGVRLWKEGRILPSLQLVAQAKVPLAGPEGGFGTGKWDYSGGVSLTKKIGGVLIFADLNYWKLGDLPDLELKDTWAYALSMGFPLSGGKYALMVSYTGMTEIISEVEPPSSLGAGVSVKVGSKSSLMINGVLGLSEATADFSLSLGWSIGF